MKKSKLLILLTVFILISTVKVNAEEPYGIRVFNKTVQQEKLDAYYIIRNQYGAPIHKIEITSQDGTHISLPEGNYTLEVGEEPEGYRTRARNGIIRYFTMPQVVNGVLKPQIQITLDTRKIGSARYNVVIENHYNQIPQVGSIFYLIDRNTGQYTIYGQYETGPDGKVVIPEVPIGDYTVIQVNKVNPNLVLRTTGIDFSVTKSQVEISVENRDSKRINQIIRRIYNPIVNNENFQDPYKYGYSQKNNTLYVKNNQAIMSGYQDNTFKPNNNLTRAETAALIAKTYSLGSQINVDLINLNRIYKDIDRNVWYAESVQFLYNLGILKKPLDERYRPDDPITRAEFVSMITRPLNYSLKETYKYADMDDRHWAKSNMDIAVDLGIIKGYTDRTIRPNNNVTRAEAATMINRLLQRNTNSLYLTEIAENKYNDIQDHWGQKEILSITTNHIVQCRRGKELSWIAKY